MRWFQYRDEAYGWLSRQFPKEETLQNAIALILAANNVGYWREARSWSTRTSKSRADFIIGDKRSQEPRLYIEAKVETKSTAMDRALGQALRNAVAGLMKTWLVIPDDVRVKEEHVRSIYAIGGEIVRISELDKKVTNFEPWAKEHRDFAFLNQWEASTCVTKNKDALEAKKIERTIKKRFHGITPDQKRRDAEASKSALNFMLDFLNMGGGSVKFVAGERGLTVEKTA